MFRAIGKYVGSYTGAKITKAEKTVAVFFGIIMLPHAGASLTFSSLAVSRIPELASYTGVFGFTYAELLLNVIGAAAIINEFIAIVVAKKALIAAKEITVPPKAKKTKRVKKA